MEVDIAPEGRVCAVVITISSALLLARSNYCCAGKLSTPAEVPFKQH
jgi:hypothetical protein